MTNMTIAVDWDHTLMDGDQWIDGAKDALNLLRERGYLVCIHSCNNPAWIRRQLEEAGLTVDRIWGEHGEVGKPVANAYVDDRAVLFSRGWANALADVETILDRDRRLR